LTTSKNSRGKRDLGKAVRDGGLEKITHAVGRPGVEDSPEPELKSTRDRILEVALDLFSEQGYDQTSLREISQRLGITKAALYYHFASKDEIFMVLHRRLHELTEGSIDHLRGARVTLESWAGLLDSFIERIPANRKLIAMHERNRVAFERIHLEDHAKEHEALDERLEDALSDRRFSLSDRVRMSCAFSAVMGGLILGGDRFHDVDSERLVSELKSAVHDLLGQPR